jgi:hypothetical protein
LTTRDIGTQLRCTRLSSTITLEESVQNRDRKHDGNPKRGDEGTIENCTAAGQMLALAEIMPPHAGHLVILVMTLPRFL